MKRIFSLLLLAIGVLSLQAQDFNLYFANNISDVSNLRSIRKSNQLNWQLVTNGALATNKVQVEGVKDMFAATAMKGREQQQQFWKMRDNTLLCFRINDGNNKGASYEVHMYYNDNQEFLYLNVSNYFFVNIPHKDDKVTIKVNKNVSGNVEKTDTTTFTYQVFDWNDDRLYTFQLDSKRQAENRSYLLEYTTKKENGQTTTKTLELKNDKFQSFYVPDEELLTAVNLISNNNGNQQKLKMDLNKILNGVWLADDFMRPRLETTFNLDKHANRELTIFNMLGTGLVERFDTLFLTVHGRKNRFVENATLNVVSLNHKGEYVADSNVKVDKYDSKKNAYRVITMGNPAYIEILAPGYCPRLYRYLGASDPATGVLDTKRCHASVTLLPGNYDSQKEVISEQIIFLLKNLNTSTTVGDKKYQKFGIDSIRTETRSKESEVIYIEDGGYQDPKMLNGKQIDKYARMRITMSVPKGKNQQSPALTAKEKGGSTSYSFTYLDRQSVLASNYPGLTRDYFDLYYNLLDPQLPEGKPYKLLLTIGDRSFGQFPYLKRRTLDYKKTEKKAEEEGKKTIALDPAKMAHGFSGFSDINFVFAPSFNFNLASIPGLAFSVVPVFHWDQMYMDLFLKLSLGWGKVKEKGRTKESRDAVNNYNVKEGLLLYSEPGSKDKIHPKTRESENVPSRKLTLNPTNKSFALKKQDKEEWFLTEFDDIFKVEGNKMGKGAYLDALVSFCLPLNFEGFYVKDITATLGYGMHAAWGGDAKDILGRLNEGVIGKLPNWLQFKAMMNAALYGEGTIGVKRYGFKRKNGVLQAGKMGWIFQLDLVARAGLALSLTWDPLGGYDPKGTWGYLSKFVSLSGNVRVGAKAQGGFAWGGQIYQGFSGSDWGFKLLIMAGGELMADIKTPVCHWRPRISGCLGNRWILPQNTGNPYHPDYPWWAKASNNARDFSHRAGETGEEGREELTPTTSFVDVGDCIISNVGGRANPTFLHNGTVALLNEQTSELNDDHVELYDISAKTTTSQSSANRQASEFSAATAGDCEAMGFSEVTQHISVPASANTQQRFNLDNEVMQNSRIVVKIRQGASGTWKETVVPKVQGEGAAEGYVDIAPRVTVQADGKAACLWKHGKFTMPVFDDKVSDMTVEDSLACREFSGKMMFSVYDGQQWTAPRALLSSINSHSTPVDYQLVMHKDSLLMAVNIVGEEEKNGHWERDVTLWYHSYVNGQLASTIDVDNVQKFSLGMVGDRLFCASIIETPDSIRDIRVKALSMRGIADSEFSTDLALSNQMPQSVKIVADQKLDNPTDFAIVWTRNDNIIRKDGKMISLPTMQTILNVSRIFMEDNMAATPHITIGATRDKLVLDAFDAYLNDNEIHTVYTLTDPETYQSRIMLSTQEFYNNFEYRLSCNDAALIGGNKMPVDLTIYNTGTSPIISVSGKINDQDITTMMTDDDRYNLYIAPNDAETIPLLYPVSADFNGVLLPKDIAADYENVFMASYSKRRGASLRRTVKPNEDNECELANGYENISCRLVNHSVEGTVNTFDIEVTDHSEDGLRDNHVVYVGVYPGPCYNIPFCDTAEQTLTADDFEIIGGERKAYVTVTVQNVSENTWGCINTFVYDKRLLDLETDEDLSDYYVVGNLSSGDCHTGVEIIPAEEDEVTGIPVVRSDEAQQHHITVARTEGGFRLSGLTSADGYVRVFDAKATPVHGAPVTTGTMFVPVSQHGVYLISTNSEIFKFNY